MFERLILSYDGKLFDPFHMPSRIMYLIPFYPLYLRNVKVYSGDSNIRKAEVPPMSSAATGRW